MRLLVIAAAALIICAAPAQAQDTSESDLRCATWAAIVLGVNEEDPAIQQAFSMALSWFLGRYEAATGIRFEDAMTPEYIVAIQPKLQAVEVECRERMSDYGDRMTRWGSQLQQSGV